MGRTRITFEIPDELRGGKYCNLAIVAPMEESQANAQLEFLFLDRSGKDDKGESYREGVLQARIIMSNEDLEILHTQLGRYLDALGDGKYDA